MATVPVFAPDGSLGDIPQTQLAAAVKAGAKPGVHITAPDGSAGVIPADRTADAVKSGAKVVPFSDQPVQHPGFWATMGSDLANMARSLPSSLEWFSGDPRDIAARSKQLSDTADAIFSNLQKEKKAGYSPAYRAAATAGTALGVNVPGIEEAAAEGNPAGVAGHIAAPLAVTAAGEAIAHGAPALSDAARSALESPSGQAATAATKAAIKKLPTSAIERIPYVGKVAGDVYQAGVDAAANARGPSAPGYERYAPNTSAPQNAPAPVTAANIPSDDEILAAVGKQAQAEPQAQTPASAPPAAAPKISQAQVERQLESALGAQKLQPGVTLRNQPAAQAAAAANPPKAPLANVQQAIQESLPPAAESSPKAPLGNVQQAIRSSVLPEGFTPVDSSVISGYKYDPAAREFTAITNNGQIYTHGDVDPAQVAAFEGADSKGRAWTTAIKNSSPLVRKNGVPVKPISTAQPEAAAAETEPAAKTSASGEGDLTDILQKSLDQLNAQKGAVATTAAPEDLLTRWGVDPESFAEGRAQTRGWTPEESLASINKLTQRYKRGDPVDPVIETRDAQNNLIDVDGRGRALAAHRAGVERIPVIVRRVPAPAP